MASMSRDRKSSTWAAPSRRVQRESWMENEEVVENVQLYRELVGITSSPAMHDPTLRLSIRKYLCFRRATKNAGYYKSVVDGEYKASIWYNVSTWVMNILLALQLAIAAALTALGAAGVSASKGTAITVLGAINTAVATGLAYMKAKGLPMRALQYRNDMRRLREHIEYTERQFMLGINADRMDPAKAVEQVKSFYNRVQKNQEKNEADADAGMKEQHPATAVTSPVRTAATQQPVQSVPIMPIPVPDSRRSSRVGPTENVRDSVRESIRDTANIV